MKTALRKYCLVRQQQKTAARISLAAVVAAPQAHERSGCSRRKYSRPVLAANGKSLRTASEFQPTWGDFTELGTAGTFPKTIPCPRSAALPRFHQTTTACQDKSRAAACPYERSATQHLADRCGQELPGGEVPHARQNELVAEATRAGITVTTASAPRCWNAFFHEFRLPAP